MDNSDTERASVPVETTDSFWRRFGEKHRPTTTGVCRALAHKKITREQFVSLLCADYTRMPPSRARSIYSYLRENGLLAYPDHEDTDVSE